MAAADGHGTSSGTQHVQDIDIWLGHATCCAQLAIAAHLYTSCIALEP
jgi:hypothetical protein